MLGPLVILAILSVIGGWIGVPAAMHGHDEIANFLAPIFGSSEPAGASNGLALTLALVSTLVAVAGWFTAHILYHAKPELPAKLAQQVRFAYLLLLNKYKVDEVYGVGVTVLMLFSRYVLQGIDKTVGGVGYAAGYTTQGFGALVARIQSGNIRSYAGWLSLGAAVLLIVTYFGLTAHLSLR